MSEYFRTYFWTSAFIGAMCGVSLAVSIVATPQDNFGMYMAGVLAVIIGLTTGMKANFRSATSTALGQLASITVVMSIALSLLGHQFSARMIYDCASYGATAGMISLIVACPFLFLRRLI